MMEKMMIIEKKKKIVDSVELSKTRKKNDHEDRIGILRMLVHLNHT